MGSILEDFLKAEQKKKTAAAPTSTPSGGNMVNAAQKVSQNQINKGVGTKVSISPSPLLDLSGARRGVEQIRKNEVARQVAAKMEGVPLTNSLSGRNARKETLLNGSARLGRGVEDETTTFAKNNGTTVSPKRDLELRMDAVKRYRQAAAIKRDTDAYNRYDAEYKDLLNRYYTAENEDAAARLGNDAAARRQYNSASTLQEDMEKVALVASNAVNGGGDAATAREYMTYLGEKYGLTDEAVKNYAIGGAAYRPAGEGYTNVWQLYEELQSQQKQAKTALEEAGYGYDRMAEYEQSREDKSEYLKEKAARESYAKEHPVLASIDSALVAPFQGVDYLKVMGSGLGKSDSEDYKSYVPMNVYNMDAVNAVSTIRETVSKEIEESTDWEIAGQNVASFLYNTGMSGVDSVVALVGAGSLGAAKAAVYLMGSSAAANQAKNVIERGGTNKQAVWSGLASGAAEVLFEKFSVENLLKITDVSTMKGLLKHTLKQAGTEASEEMLTEISNILSDAAIMGNRSEFEESVRAYISRGMSESEAREQAFRDALGQVAWAGAGGALTGGVMGGGVSGIDLMSRRSRAAETQQRDETSRAINPTTVAPQRSPSPRLRGGEETEEVQPDRAKSAPTEAVEAEEADILTMSPVEYAQREAARQAQATGQSEGWAEGEGGVEIDYTQSAANAAMAYNQERQEQARRLANATSELERSGIRAGASSETIAQAERLSKALGREIVFYRSDAGEYGIQNGFYATDDGVIHVNSRSQNPVAQIIAHELTHSLENAGSYEQLSDLILTRIERTEGDLTALRQAKAELYARNGEPLESETDVDREIVAEYVEKKLLTDEKAILEVVQEDRSLGRRILDWLNGLLAKLGNKSAQERAFLTKARDAYAKALQESQTSFTEQTSRARLETGRQELADQWNRGELTDEEYDAALEEMEHEESLAGMSELDRSLREERAEERSSIEELPDGKKYVRADRQVIFGNDPESWSEQLEDYINGKIRRGQDVKLVAEDGDVLTLTAETAGKVASMYNNDGTTMSEEAFERKVNAGAHIDELTQVSERGKKIVQDYGGRHGEFASGGWNYRTAYFRDFDGKYYRVRISVAQNADGSVVYNIGDMQERSFPAIAGSSANGGALNRKTSFKDSISDEEGAVNTKNRKYSYAGEKAKGADMEALNPYSAHQVENWKNSKRIVLCETSEQLKDFVLKSLWDKAYDKKLYFGAVSKDFADRIENETGLRVEGFNCSLASNEIRKMFKSHGNEEREALRGQRAVTAEDIVKIPEIIRAPERIEKSQETYNGKPAIIFKGENDGTMSVVAVVSDKRLDLFVQTAYIGAKKRDLATPTDVQASAFTSETPRGTASNDNITENGNGVKQKFSISETEESPGPLPLVLPGNETEQSDASEEADSPSQSASQTAPEPPQEATKYSRGALPKGEPREQQGEAKNSERKEDPVITSLPTKARDYLERIERGLVGRIGGALSVPRFVQRDFLQNAAREISTEYLKEGMVSEEKLTKVFEKAYAEGVVVDETFYNQYRHIKDHLRQTAVTISEEDTHDIPDWNSFRKSTFGTLRIVKDGGLPVDMAYGELRDMAPELFPANITAPSDQLRQMYDVGRSIRRAEYTLDEYHGSNAAAYKRTAKNDFDAIINENLSELQKVRRYADDRAAVREPKVEMTHDEVMETYKEMKRARRNYEKVSAKHLLTKRDQILVGRLLRGEMELEHLDPQKDNVKGITEVYEAKLEYEAGARLIREWNAQRKAKLRDRADELLKTAINWKDKKMGILYSRETMERNIQDIVKDKALAAKIIKEYFTPVHKAVAKATKAKNQYRDRVEELKLSRKVEKGNQVSEAYAVQFLGEAEDNIRVLSQKGLRNSKRDGKTLEDWRAEVDNLWANNPGLDEQKIRNAVEEFRKIYDELFQQMNEARVRNGYEPVNYRQGYFPHFQGEDGDGIVAIFGKALGISTDVTTLPTSINGLTHTFKPGIRWFGNAMERQGYNTTYDAVEGFDRYIEGVADVIYLTDAIQNLRALGSQIRYRTGDEGLRRQVDEVRRRTDLSEKEKEELIQRIHEEGQYSLNNFVVELEEYTNLLANKKSRADRNMEQAMGRKAYNVVKGFEGRVAANMIVGNIGSYLTNFIPLTQGWTTVHTGNLLAGMWDTLKASVNDDGIVGMSDFLTNRRGSDPLVKTWAQKASGVATKPMEYIDNFTAGSLVRARYRQNLKKMSEAAAMEEADAWIAGVMADRSKGSTPTLFSRSNPMTKLFTQFQLEVNNQYSYLFKDVPRDLKKKGLAAITVALFKFLIGTFLFNEAFEHFFGRRPALDPVNMLLSLADDLSGWNWPGLPEAVGGLVSGDFSRFEDEAMDPAEAVMNMGGELADQIPFVGGLLGGGRIPISSALPDAKNLLKAAVSSEWSLEKKLGTAADELGGSLAYILLPSGGGQIKKGFEAGVALAQKGVYGLDSEGEQQLKYPFYADNPAEAFGNLALAALFGTTTLPTGREWVENGFQSLSAKKTAVYQDMMAAGVTGRDAFELLQELGKVQETEESAAELKRQLLRESEVSGEGKAIVYYGLLASDKERELMDEVSENGADLGEVTSVLMEIKDASGLTGASASNMKRDAISESSLSDEDKITVFRYMMGTKQDDGSYVTSRDEQIKNFLDAGMDFDTFLDAYNQYSTINEDESYPDATSKATAFSRWVNNNGFTGEKASTIRENFKYYSQIAQTAERYETFTAEGMEDEVAYELVNTLSELEPEVGKEDVTSIQKYWAVVNSPISDEEMDIALRTMMRDGTLEKYENARVTGIDPRTYVYFLDEISDISGDGKKDRILKIINSMDLTVKQKDALHYAAGYKDSTLYKAPWH